MSQLTSMKIFQKFFWHYLKKLGVAKVFCTVQYINFLSNLYEMTKAQKKHPHSLMIKTILNVTYLRTAMNHGLNAN